MIEERHTTIITMTEKANSVSVRVSGSEVVQHTVNGTWARPLESLGREAREQHLKTRSSWWKRGNIVQIQTIPRDYTTVQSFLTRFVLPIAQAAPTTAYISPRPACQYSSKDKPSPLVRLRIQTASVVGGLRSLPCSRLCLKQGHQKWLCSPNK